MDNSSGRGSNNMNRGGCLLGEQSSGGSIIESSGESSLGGGNVLCVGNVGSGDLSGLLVGKATGCGHVEGCLELGFGRYDLSGILKGQGSRSGKESSKDLN